MKRITIRSDFVHSGGTPLDLPISKASEFIRVIDHFAYIEQGALRS